MTANEAVTAEPMEPTMTRLATAALVALSLAAGTAAQAQSYTAPAGVPVQATQAGGR